MPRAKRKIVQGFPREFVFESREELNTYLSGDRVTCLRCGHSFRILDTHLRCAHGMTSDEYRQMYGIPYERGLCAADFSEQRVEHGKTLFENNKERQMAAMRLAIETQNKIEFRQRNKPHFWKKERTKHSADVFREFMKRVIEGRTLGEVSKDDDMPHFASVFWYMRRDQSFAIEWENSVPKRTLSEAVRLAMKNKKRNKGANPSMPS